MNGQNIETGVPKGYLRVKVSTARGAVPIAGARVALRGTTPETSGIIALLTTDSGGLTETIALDAPDPSLSEAPNAEKPFAEYDLEISAEGYGTQFYYGIPIFAAITSVQDAELVPFVENGYPEFLNPNARSDRYFPRETEALFSPETEGEVEQ